MRIWGLNDLMNKFITGKQLNIIKIGTPPGSWKSEQWVFHEFYC